MIDEVHVDRHVDCGKLANEDRRNCDFRPGAHDRVRASWYSACSGDCLPHLLGGSRDVVGELGAMGDARVVVLVVHDPDAPSGRGYEVTISRCGRPSLW